MTKGPLIVIGVECSDSPLPAAVEKDLQIWGEVKTVKMRLASAEIFIGFCLAVFLMMLEKMYPEV